MNISPMKSYSSCSVPEISKMIVHTAVLSRKLTKKDCVLKQNAFTRSVIISVGVSKLGKIIFVEQGTKINSQYYRDHVLSVMLEGMRDMSDGDYIFLQDSAGAQFFAHSWSPHFSNLNFLEFYDWSCLETRV